MSLTGSNCLNYDLANWVVNSKFVPVLTFGGSSKGFQYSTQQGTYSRTCCHILFSFQLVLTSKGSGTGSAQITLPVTTNGSRFIFQVQQQNITMANKSIFAVGDSNSASCTLYFSESNKPYVTVSNSDFNNTSAIDISGWYSTN